MRLHIICVGRLRAGAERSLVVDYLDRFDKTGRSMGLGPVRVVEVEDKKKIGSDEEARLLQRALPAGARVIMLDERGKTMTSPKFSALIASNRDQGQQDLAFVIGGADGIAPNFRTTANHLISFGPMVWPHMLVRVMLAEQLYRAATILAGSPYHRA